jgi:AcrR family transcriptional regulator
MGRKSLAEERRAAILAAFERCVVRYGLDVSLEQIAEEAGMQRSIIRHYLGNRDELVSELIARIAHEYPQQIAAALEQADVPEVLDGLFRPEVTYNDWDFIIIAVLTAAKERYPQAHEQLTVMLDRVIDSFSEWLIRAYPHVPPERCRQVAYGIFCLSQANETFLWLNPHQENNAAARFSAEVLIRSLE